MAVPTDLIDIAVIGAGSAGTMVYLRAVLNWDRTVLFTGDAKAKRRAKSTWVRKLDTIPGFQGLNYPITTSTATTLKWLESHPQLRDKGTVLPGLVTGLEQDPFGFRLEYKLKEGPAQLWARYIILATGIMEIQPEIQGSIRTILPFTNTPDLIYSLEDEGHHTLEHRRLSVMGSGDPALEAVILLAERYKHTGIAVLTHGLPDTFSTRLRVWAERYRARFYTSPITAILGDPHAEGLTGYQLASGETVATDCCVIAMGFVVYNELLTALNGKIDADGRVLVSPSYETSVPKLFAVGNMVAGKRLQLQTAWDSAVEAADEINRRLRQQRRGTYGF